MFHRLLRRSLMRFVSSLHNSRPSCTLCMLGFRHQTSLIRSQYSGMMVQKRFFNISPCTNNNSNQNNDKQDKKKESFLDFVKRILNSGTFNAIILFLFAWRVYIEYFKKKPNSDQYERQPDRYISWKEFEEDLVKGGEIDHLLLWMDTVFIYLKPDALFHGKPLKGYEHMYPIARMSIDDPDEFEMKLRLLETAIGIPTDMQIPLQIEKPNPWRALFIYVGLFLATVALVRYAVKKSAIFKTSFKPDDLLGGSRHIKVARQKGFSFKDIAGLHEAKVEVMEVVDYLKNPSHYKRLGARVPKGALLTGPPGCGKTVLAKAVSAEANVPFLSISGSEFVEMFGGVGASRVRSLFKDARSNAPSIIYIDEIDAIGRQRRSQMSDYGSQEEEHTLNQLLSEMDGMGSVGGVIVLAATNRADLLDDALLRPGRFDRHILIDYPTLAERIELFNMYMSKLKIGDTITDLKSLNERSAQLSPGMSGADIANVCNEAAIHAASSNKDSVELSDVDFAIEKVLAGSAKRTNVLSPQEKRVIAFREAGHAIVAWFSENVNPPLKMSIIPRTSGKFSFMQMQTKKEFGLYTEEELLDQMCTLMGGRVAESMVFNHVSSASHDQLKKVTDMARSQVQELGMSPVVGNLSFSKTEELEIRPYSNNFQGIMDQEVSKIVAAVYDKTFSLLNARQELLKSLAELLLQKETLSYSDLKELLGLPANTKFNAIGTSSLKQNT